MSRVKLEAPGEVVLSSRERIKLERKEARKKRKHFDVKASDDALTTMVQKKVKGHYKTFHSNFYGESYKGKSMWIPTHIRNYTKKVAEDLGDGNDNLSVVTVQKKIKGHYKTFHSKFYGKAYKGKSMWIPTHIRTYTKKVAA